MKNIKFISNSPLETMNFGASLIHKLPLGITLLLTGDLGAGKTTLVKGIAKGLDIKEIVQSPTFNIMKIYFDGIHPLIHIDAYRLLDVNSDIGLDEYIGYETGYTVIEWPMYIPNLIPPQNIEINIVRIDDNTRQIVITASDDSLLKGVE